MPTLRAALLLTVLCLALAACGSSKKTATPGTAPRTGAPAGTVNGIVTDIGTGGRLAGVVVTGPGGLSATTDASGQFTLTGVTTAQLTFAKAGYAPGYANASATTAGDVVAVRLKQQPAEQAYDATQAATLSQVTEAGPYALRLQPDSLDTADTRISISITPLDPTKEREALPGSLVAGGASSTLLLPVTFAEFSLLDSAGRRVNLKPSASAIVELPVPPSLRGAYPLGTPVHCYSYDPATGKWVDFVDGLVQLSSVDGTSPVVAASIRHFSWYGAAPEGNNCKKIYLTVVSAVDGRPLGNARVEASPGSTSYTDPDGNAQVVYARGNGYPSFTAYQTGIDVDGSLTGMPGAKYIEFGKVVDDLEVPGNAPCTAPTGSAGPRPVARDRTVRGEASDPLVIRVGLLTNVIYEVNGMLNAGQGAFVLLQEGAPGPDGTIDSPQPSSGARIFLAEAGGTPVQLTEVQAGSGSYALLASLPVVAGRQYTLTVDADGNGSVDGSATVTAMGALTWTSPTAGATVSASGLTASWTDAGAGAGGAAYAPVYAVTLLQGSTGVPDVASYVGTARQFAATSAMNRGQPLQPGTYTGSLMGFSGWTSGAGGLSVSNNVTGLTVSGQFYSASIATPISFTVQ